MSYDAVGNVAQVVKPSGTATVDDPTDGIVAYTYDAANRPVATMFSDDTVGFTYDYSPAGRVLSAARVQNGGVSASSAYTYDTAGRTTATVRTGPGGGGANYSYTSAGRLSGAAWSTGMAVAYNYNQVGELTTVTPSGTGSIPAVTYGYDPSGRVTTVTREGQASATTTAAVYDAAGQLVSLEHSTTAGVAQGYAITRDVRGNPTQVDTTTSAGTTSALYTYDVVSRLKSECYPVLGDTCTGRSPRNAYTYDLVGNRATLAVRTVAGAKPVTVSTGFTYDAAYQLLTQSVAGTPTVTNTWTPNGALATSTTPAGIQTYTTDLTDELISLTLADSSTVGYTHDAQGNRTSRTVDGLLDVSWAWAWDDLSSLPVRIGEYDAAGTLATAWLVDPTSLTGASLAQTSSGSSSWLLSDPFANTVASVSTTGNTVSGTRTMDAFGVERTSATGWLADAAVGFAGQYLDDATGLYDMRARDYDPTSGRFTATDPIAVPTGMPFVAGYSYSYNNPLMYSDVNGMNPFSDVVSGAASAAWDFALNDIALTQPNLGGASGWAAQRRYNMYRGFRLGVQENGYWTQINLTINPVSQLLQSGDATITSYKEGDYHGVGYNGVNTTIAAASTAAIGCGGAKFITSKIPSVATIVAVRTPEFIAVGDVKLPGVPKGATGVPVPTGKGLYYEIPKGTAELDPRVSGVRIMDPVTSGPYQYPNGYAAYMNAEGQTVNPLTGKTVVGNADPYAHIELP